MIEPNVYLFAAADRRAPVSMRAKRSRQMQVPGLAAVQLQDRHSRIAWAVLARGRDYQPRIAPNAA